LVDNFTKYFKPINVTLADEGPVYWAILHPSLIALMLDVRHWGTPPAKGISECMERSEAGENVDECCNASYSAV
jgi:hypothetical protein